jgi:hypothetical protein
VSSRLLEGVEERLLLLLMLGWMVWTAPLIEMVAERSGRS